MKSRTKKEIKKDLRAISARRFAIAREIEQLKRELASLELQQRRN